MQHYSAPVVDLQFLLHDVLAVSAHEIPGYSELERDFTEAIFNEAGKLAVEVLAPLNAVGDREGCRLENGVVRTPAGFKAAFEALKAGGWNGIDLPQEYGGQGLPVLVATATGEIFCAANLALTIFQGLTHGAINALLASGSAEQKALYLPKMMTMDWTGTMNLTEPHCGTDLGLIRTRAEPEADGSFRITGQKIFISAGDHDLAENVIHLVLAKAPGGGAGTKGISLFLVPKILVNPDGSLGALNAVSVGKIEEKMGIHGSPTCLMNYDGARGWLVGALHEGLKAMFVMMNEARLGVGLQGYALAEAAYQAARAYARERRQGRAVPQPADPNAPADPIIVHPDVRRMLMDIKSFVEGARALTLWAATLIDRGHRLGDKAAHGLVSLLTPVIKGFCTDQGFAACVSAQQVFGGHGYIEEWGMSQFVRDARIAMIYEGANGIQALDLVARKLPADGGRYAMAFLEEVRATLKTEADDAFQRDILAPLKAGSKDLEAALGFFMERGLKDPNEALAGSTDFLHLFGHVALGLMWARMAQAAVRALAEGRGDERFHRAKLATARYYMARQLPATALHLARIRSGAAPVMALEAAAF